MLYFFGGFPKLKLSSVVRKTLAQAPEDSSLQTKKKKKKRKRRKRKKEKEEKEKKEKWVVVQYQN